jgi:hypothetical protein
VGFGNGGLGVVCPVGGRAGERAVARAVQAVRCAGLFLGARARGDDAQVAIDLGAVSIDHRAAGAFGERKCQAGLAAGGWPRDKRQRRREAHVHCHADSSRSADERRNFERGGCRPGAGAEPNGRSWIEPDTACDLLFGGNPEPVRAALDGLFPGVDLVVQGEAGRRKRLLAADMDSTIITVECIDELADYAGVKGAGRRGDGAGDARRAGLRGGAGGAGGVAARAGRGGAGAML